MKKCTGCFIEKPITDFNAHKGGAQGVKALCKACCAIKLKTLIKQTEDSEGFKAFVEAGCPAKVCTNCGTSYTKRPDITENQYYRQRLCRRSCPMPKEMRTLQDDKNKARASDYAIAYRQTENAIKARKAEQEKAKVKYHSDEEYRLMWIARQRAYVEKSGYKRPYNSEIRAKNLKWLDANREHFNKWQREYRKRKIHEFAWRSMLKSACLRMGKAKMSSSIEELGYSAEQLKLYLSSLFSEGMTWENYGEWHIDHIKPVSLFLPDTLPSVVNALSNLQPLWALDNIRKSNKYEQNA